MTLSYSEAAKLPVLESCEGCGACCMSTAVPPYVRINGVHEAELRKVPVEIMEEILPYWEVRFQLPERPCMWFDAESKSCRHYELRPSACRDFELNSPFCHAIRDRWTSGG